MQFLRKTGHINSKFPIKRSLLTKGWEPDTMAVDAMAVDAMAEDALAVDTMAAISQKVDTMAANRE